MALRIEVRVEGWEKIKTGFSKVKNRFTVGLEKAMFKASVYITSSVQRNFIEGGRPTPWQKHGPLTTLIRGKNAPILRDSGALMNSIAPFHNVEDGSFGASTNLDYAPLMNYGGTSKGGVVDIPETQVQAHTRVSRRGGRVEVKAHTVKAHSAKIGPHDVPARPFMVFQEEDRQAIPDIFKGELDGTRD